MWITAKHRGGSAWDVVKDTAFVYDGWNLIAELDVSGSSPALLRSHAWGLDLSQSLQGAGGVGGLLCSATVTMSGTVVHYPAYDGNGNVIGYVDGDTGAASLKLDYDPFGNPVMVAVAGSTVAKALPFRFSTKYEEDKTGLLYYGYRYYAAGLGRWLSRDPIEEQGGVNLYGFAGNNGTNLVDPFGLTTGALDMQLWEATAEGLSGLSAAARTAVSAAGAQSAAAFGKAATLTPAGLLGAAIGTANFGPELVKAYGETDLAVCDLRVCESLLNVMNPMFPIIQAQMNAVSVALTQQDIPAAASAAQALDAAAMALEAMSGLLRIACGESAADSALMWANHARQTSKGAREQMANSVGAKKAMAGSESSLQGAQLKRHLTQQQKYGAAGSKTLENGRIRYYGNIEGAKKPGEMAGRRLVREWDPSTNATRTWHETLDHAGNIRQVRPEDGGPKVHYRFDANGNYLGSW